MKLQNQEPYSRKTGKSMMKKRLRVSNSESLQETINYQAPQRGKKVSKNSQVPMLGNRVRLETTGSVFQGARSWGASHTSSGCSTPVRTNRWLCSQQSTSPQTPQLKLKLSLCSSANLRRHLKKHLAKRELPVLNTAKEQ